MQILTQTFGLAQTQSYLLIHENQAVWIDPAPLSGSWVDKCIEKWKSQNPLSEITPVATILTHSHWDHISDLGKSKFFAKTAIYVHPLDLPNIQNPGADGLSWPDSVDKPLLKNPCFHFLEDQTPWFLGEHTFTTFHTPGHSPGSCVFYSPSCQLLISGDTLFASGWGRVDFPSSSPVAMRKSLSRLSCLDSSASILPGHGPSKKIGDLFWLADAIQNDCFWS